MERCRWAQGVVSVNLRSPWAGSGCRRAAAVSAVMVSAAAVVGCDGSTSAPDAGHSAAGPASSASPSLPNSPALTAAVDAFFENSYAPGKDNVRAVLVSVAGRPIMDRYYRGSLASDTANVASVTTSVVCTLVGIALAGAASTTDWTRTWRSYWASMSRP